VWVDTKPSTMLLMIKVYFLANGDISLSDHGLFALVFDGKKLTEAQFIQLLELFLNNIEDESLTNEVIIYVREGYLGKSCELEKADLQV
jgi:hypothetical protein